jgi:hypothetical protein
LLADFGILCSDPTPLQCEGTSAIKIAKKPVKHELTKHIGVDASFIRYHCQQLIIDIQYVPSELQVVDFFTKAASFSSSQTQCVRHRIFSATFSVYG